MIRSAGQQFLRVEHREALRNHDSQHNGKRALEDQMCEDRRFTKKAGRSSYIVYGCFLKWWYPTTMGFPTKNDHFGVFWGYHHNLRKHPYSEVV